jgi:hypothetical protein
MKPSVDGRFCQGGIKMSEPRKDLGENDINFPDVVSDLAEKVADSVSHALHPLVERYAQMFAHGARTPVLKRPSDVGFRHEDAFFASLDGIPLEAWFIPAGSEELLIVNQPMTCNRYGFPGHLPPWNTCSAALKSIFCRS